MSKYERVARLMKIMTIIRARQNVSRSKLAEACEVHVRTIQRDINTLCYAGIPIFWSGEGGYKIMPDFFLPPVNLSLEEAFGLVMTAGTLPEDEIGFHPEAVESAVSKVIARLPDDTRHRLQMALDTAKSGGGEFSDLLDEINNSHLPGSFRVLAGNIAHDLNSTLTALLGNISLAGIYARSKEMVDKVHEKLAEAEKASIQAKALAQQLLTISSGVYDGHTAAQSQVALGAMVDDSTCFFPEAFSVDAEEMADKTTTHKNTGMKRILVMDDEENVRDVACELLSLVGYSTTSAMDGAEAVNLYIEARESGRPYSAVMLDLVVPGGMGGKEALLKLMDFDPEVKAIVSSGYSNDPIMSHFRDYGFSGVIAKPYEVNSLGGELHRVLTVDPAAQ